MFLYILALYVQMLCSVLYVSLYMLLLYMVWFDMFRVLFCSVSICFDSIRSGFYVPVLYVPLYILDSIGSMWWFYSLCSTCPWLYFLFNMFWLCSTSTFSGFLFSICSYHNVLFYLFWLYMFLSIYFSSLCSALNVQTIGSVYLFKLYLVISMWCSSLYVLILCVLILHLLTICSSSIWSLYMFRLCSVSQENLWCELMMYK